MIRERKLFYTYYKKSQALNFFFSLLMAALGLSIGLNYFNCFAASIMTGGYVLSVYFYERRFQKQYYFYFNKGLSKRELLVYSYLLNGVLVAALMLITIKIR